MQAYKIATTILAQDKSKVTGNGLSDDGNGNVNKSKEACDALTAQNGPLVADGIQNLQKAVELNPTYDDAMQYLNLTYRRKADLDCTDDAARKADLASADQWTQKAMGARKENEKKKEEKNGGGVDMSK
jgi:hypothetical protein